MRKLLISIMLLTSSLCAAECKYYYDAKKEMVTIVNDDEKTILKIKIATTFKEDGVDWIGCDVCYETFKPTNETSCKLYLDLLDDDGFPVFPGKYMKFDTKVSPKFVGRLHDKFRFKKDDLIRISSFETYEAVN